MEPSNALFSGVLSNIKDVLFEMHKSDLHFRICIWISVRNIYLESIYSLLINLMSK